LKQVLIRQGQAVIEEVPAPEVEAGFVLVQVDHSCISTGTELSGVKRSGAPLWKRALQEPDKARRVMQSALSQGIGAVRALVENKLAASAAGIASGYSASGVILKVGEGVQDLALGDRVACAGAQYAHHAEIICVPRNLVVSVPEGLPFAAASTVTLGAIALQGVRRAIPTLGETFVVIGLGILGQLTAQILRANGCRVIGMDLQSHRIELAHQLGMEMDIQPEGDMPIAQAARLTDGIGADGVIITAATPSDGVISTAFQMCRKRGRVVLVGDVGLHINRADMYEKELDFFISTSYGPGRYDRHYEAEGLDYPVGYVRWTENRNMSEYLRLLSEKRVIVDPLIGGTFPVDQAGEAYTSLETASPRPLVVLLSYPKREETILVQRVSNPTAPKAHSGQIRIAVVGAGSFSKGVHLPNLKALSGMYHLSAIMNRSGDSAALSARQFGAAAATTSYKQILEDADIDAVLIATRHNLHTRMALEALSAGKHVFLEKPLALTVSELDDIRAFFEKRTLPTPILQTGFNRRFSPYARRIHQWVHRRTNPMILNYRMNAGYLPLDHWVHTTEGGGRNLGEACHIYDLFTFLTGSRVMDIQAYNIAPATQYYSARDNFAAVIKFEDGSVATLTYTALGSTEYPKEQMEIFVDGRVIVLDDYKRLAVVGSKGKGIESTVVDKGHREELEAFGHSIQQGGTWAIPLWEQIQATEIALRVEAQLR